MNDAFVYWARGETNGSTDHQDRGRDSCALCWRETEGNQGCVQKGIGMNLGCETVSLYARNTCKHEAHDIHGASVHMGKKEKNNELVFSVFSCARHLSKVILGELTQCESGAGIHLRQSLRIYCVRTPPSPRIRPATRGFKALRQGFVKGEKEKKSAGPLYVFH